MIDTSLENGDSPYEAMQGVMDQFGREADKIAAAAGDDLAAAAAIHGFDRDPHLTADLQAVEAAAVELKQRVRAAKAGLTGRHADGAEYHTGQDANASAFRPS